MATSIQKREKSQNRKNEHFSRENDTVRVIPHKRDIRKIPKRIPIHLQIYRNPISNQQERRQNLHRLQTVDFPYQIPESTLLVVLKRERDMQYATQTSVCRLCCF